MKLNDKTWKWAFCVPACLTGVALPVAAVSVPAGLQQVQTGQQQPVVALQGVVQMNPTTVELIYANQQRVTLDFYGENMFRLFQDPQGGIVRNPAANPPAQILVDQPRKEVGRLQLADADGKITLST